MKDNFYLRGKGNTTSEPIVRLEKRDTSACPSGEQTTWLYWPWRHVPILNSWDFALMTHSTISEALCLTHLCISVSGTRRKPSCGANLHASFLWHVSCGFLCCQMLVYELSFNCQCQCLSTVAALVLDVGTVVHTNNWLEWLGKSSDTSDQILFPFRQPWVLGLMEPGARTSAFPCPSPFTPSRHYSAWVTKGFHLGLFTVLPGNRFNERWLEAFPSF